MVIIGNYYSVNLSLFTFSPKVSSSGSRVLQTGAQFLNRLVLSSLLYHCICNKELFSHFSTIVCSYCLSPVHSLMPVSAFSS